MTHEWKSNLLALALLFAASSFSPAALGDEWNRETVVTLSAPVEAPGVVLPAGTYVFRLADAANRNIVQIFTEDHMKLLATILTAPAYRNEPSSKTVITLEERPAGGPEAIHEWFYPGETDGVEFLYKAQLDDDFFNPPDLALEPDLSSLPFGSNML